MIHISPKNSELCTRKDKRVRDKYIYMRDYYNDCLDKLRYISEQVGEHIPFYIRKVFGGDRGRG